MIPVRMGEIAVSATPGEELVALGLGSCIGLVMVDRAAGVAGMVHVVLPDSGGTGASSGKFADSAVPELLRQLTAAGAVKRRLQVAMGGGARMFDVGGGLDIGVRNAAAVKQAVSRAGLTVTIAETGGRQGRTVRVTVPHGEVTSRVAGGQPQVLLAAGHVAGATASRPASTARSGTRAAVAGR